MLGLFDADQEIAKAYQEQYGYAGMKFCYTEGYSKVSNIAYNILYQAGGAGGSISTPLVFLLDSSGKIFYRSEGYFEANELADKLDDYTDLTYSADSVTILQPSAGASYAYSGNAIKPYVAAIKGNMGLTAGVHYNISYQNNTNAGTGYVVLTGIKYMKGTKKIPFKITPKSINSGTIYYISPQTYTGSEKKPAVVVACDGVKLVAGRDYAASYTNNINCGWATVTVTGKGNYTGSIQKSFQITKAELTDSCVDPIKDCVFTGKEVKPAVTVRYGGKVLVKDRDYTVRYTNNVNRKYATAIITGKGNYSGTVYAPFTIKSVNLFTVNGYKYKITNFSKKKVSVLGNVNEKRTTITIPTTVKFNGINYTVTAVSAKAFYNNKKIKKVTIPKNVESIGDNAFAKCTKLTTVKFDNGSKLKNIEKNVFESCTSLKTITIPSNVKKIGSKAFYKCSKLQSMTIKSSNLKSVGGNALNGIHSKCKIKVPSKKLSAYEKLLGGKGQKKTVKIVKL